MKRHKVCDGTKDCQDNSDEEGCEEKLTRPIHRNQFMVTTTRYEEPVRDQWTQTTPSETPAATSYANYPDFPITYLQPSLNGKLSNAGLISYSQIKAKQDIQHPKSHQAFDIRTQDYSKIWRNTAYPDYNKYSQYITSKQNTPYEKSTASLPSPHTRITQYGTSIPTSTKQPTTPHWERLVSVQTYPRTQTLLVGYDAVLQCRDEGRLRRDVFWQRGGGRELPAHSSQERGRLEILGVTPADEGDYECVAVGHEHEDGGKQISSFWIQRN